MRSKIANSHVSEMWKSIHPQAKQPPIKAYYVNKADLNKIADQSHSGKGNLYQTKHEYGTLVTSKNSNIRGVHYKHGREHVILVKKQGTQAKTNRVIKHELGHIRK